MTRKLNNVNDNSKSNYDATNQITCNKKVLKSNLCDCNNTYILVKGDITATAAPEVQAAFKNCAPFTKCIIKINETTISGAEDLDLIMLMYNLIEYSSNYSETTGSLWFYSKDEASNFDGNIAKYYNFKSFKCKAKLLGNTAVQFKFSKHATNTVPLKYLSNIKRSLEMALINCKVEIKLKWTKYCVLSVAGTENDANHNNNANNIIFTIKDTKLYVLVVTLLARDNQKLSELLSKVFELSVHWNEYKTKSENKNATKDYRYFLESNFVGFNRLFVLVYANEDANTKRFKAKIYYLPEGIIENYNVFIS